MDRISSDCRRNVAIQLYLVYSASLLYTDYLLLTGLINPVDQPKPEIIIIIICFYQS